MDIKNEDKIVRQIEKSLSNNLNENLFLTGNVFGNTNMSEKSYNPSLVVEDGTAKLDNPEYPLVSNERLYDPQVSISRAEYIRQAREACLRQLSNTQVYSRAYDVNYMEAEADDTQLSNKKEKAWKLFSETTQTEASDEASPGEIAAFRSLIIRTICALVIFLFVFTIDKLELNIGKLSHTMIREYVTGKDTLEILENILVTWLK